jgi:hypothetical protein
MTTAVEIKLPVDLASKAQSFVKQGFATDMDHLMAEALSRYLESHEPELTEAFIREDVKWGLHGDS